MANLPGHKVASANEIRPSTEDSYVGSDEIRRRAADQAGAHTEVLNGLGHWWMVQDPARGAVALTRFWELLD